MRKPFLRLEFRKGRFEDGGMPLSVIPRLRSVDDALRAIARELFFEDNSARQRVRVGFDGEFELVLKTLQVGSALLEIERSWSHDDGAFSDLDDEFQLAPSRLFDGVRALQRDEEAVLSLPTLKALTTVFGALEEDEELTIVSDAATQAQSLVVNQETARRVATAAQRPPREREKPLYVVGRPFALNDEAHTMTLRVREQEARLVVPVKRDDKKACLDAIGRNDTTLTRIVGTAVHGDSGELLRVNSGVQMSPIAGPSLSGRFAELVGLRDGWLDGDGVAPTKAFLKRAEAAAWRFVEEVGLDRPHVYPMPDGGVQAEWDVGDLVVEVAMRPARARVEFSGVATSRRGHADLDETEDVSTVVRWLSGLLESVAGARDV